MLKFTQAALSIITEEVQNNTNEDQKPMVRLSMGIG